MARPSQRWLPLATGATLIALTACVLTACNSAQPAGNNSPGGGGAGGTGPIPVTFSLDSAHASKRAVDGSGATLTATGADGTGYALTVPPGALTTSLELKMTPLTKVTVEGGVAPWQVGVELAPEGTQFLKPVTLTITPPQASSTEAAITLVTADGTRYVPQATGTTGASFTAQLDHFSDYLVGPYSPALVAAGIQALLDHLASPPTIVDVQSLLRLWPQAQGSALAKARAALDQQLSAEIAALADSQQADPNPPLGSVVGSISAGKAAAAAGRTDDASTLNANAQRVFGTLMRVLDLAIGKAGYQQPHIALLEAFVGPLAQAADVARAYPFVLQYAIDPQSEAAKLVTDIVGSADHDCNQGYPNEGLTGLQDAIGAVHLLQLSSPTDTELQNDADNCGVPTFTGATIGMGATSASATYSDSTAGNDASQSNPPATITGPKLSASASASVAYASANVSLTTDANGDTGTLVVSGTASASVPDTTASSLAGASFSVDNSSPDPIRLNFDHARGDYLVTVSWQHGTPLTIPNETSGGMTIGGVTTASGTETYHVHGLLYLLGDPLPPGGMITGAYTPQFTAVGNAGLYDYSSDASASISVSGTITVTIAPWPNGLVE